MKVRLKRLLESLGLRPRSPPTRMFVSLSVKHAMRPSSLSRQSTRVILRISIWTCLVLMLLFLVIYTILLAYVDNRLHTSLIDAPGIYRKVKLNGKFKLHKKYPWKTVDSANFYLSKNFPRKALWNSSEFYHIGEPLPQCKWQTVFRILITSSPEHYDRRNMIRQTWCNPLAFKIQDHAWHCVFLVGQSFNASVNHSLQKEKERHSDLLIGNYLDTYRNLTLKVIHGFNWSINFCPSSFVVKTDDDCFVNTGLLYEFLLHYNHITNKLYAGSIVEVREKLKVIRDKNKKWAVSYEDFEEEYYPPYASGIGYVLSTDVAKDLVAESAFVKPIANEDAYVGIVMAHLGVNPVSSMRFAVSSSGLTLCNFIYLFMVHAVTLEHQTVLMEKALKAKDGCKQFEPITSWS